MNNERWRPVPGFRGYEVSDLGRVRSWRPSNGDRPRVLRPYRGSQKPGRAYYSLKVGLMRNGHRHKVKVAHLVLYAFIGLPPVPRYEASHLDDDPENNTLSNLCWESREHNERRKALNRRLRSS